MNVLERIRGGLIVSVQAWANSAIDDPYVLAAMAAAAEANGARAVRVAGAVNLLAVRARVTLPVIGIVKRAYPGYEPYITPTAREVAEIVACGADIVAFDATARERPGNAGVADMIRAIHSTGRLAMADCSTAQDGIAAVNAGADLVATTLAGYTDETRGRSLPALDLVGELRGSRAFVVCEGGVAVPSQVTQAFAAGAKAVVVGTAITNVDARVREFVACGDNENHR